MPDWFNQVYYDLVWPILGSPAVTILLVFLVRYLDKRDQRKAERELRDQIDRHEREKLALLRAWLQGE